MMVAVLVVMEGGVGVGGGHAGLRQVLLSFGASDVSWFGGMEAARVTDSD